MPISRRLAIFAVFAWLSAGCVAARPRPQVLGDEPALDDTLKKLIDAHNDEREKKDLPPLEENDALKKAAQAHADDMAKRRKMDHTGGDGSTPFKRIEKAGYRYQRAGENIAYGQRGLDELMDAWMTSPGHKRNILGKFKQIGVAYAIDEDGTPYWCVTFGTPLPQ